MNDRESDSLGGRGGRDFRTGVLVRLVARRTVEEPCDATESCGHRNGELDEPASERRELGDADARARQERRAGWPTAKAYRDGEFPVFRSEAERDATTRVIAFTALRARELSKIEREVNDATIRLELLEAEGVSDGLMLEQAQLLIQKLESYVKLLTR